MKIKAWDPTEAATLEAIPLPRLVCWEGIIATAVLAGMPPDEFCEEVTEAKAPPEGRDEVG